MLQAIVTLEEKTTERHIVRAVTIPWFEYVAAMLPDPRLMQQIYPRAWEAMLAQLASTCERVATSRMDESDSK